MEATSAMTRDGGTDEAMAAAVGDAAAALGDALRHGDERHVPAELNTVRLAARLRAVADAALQLSVDRARAVGHTWQEIGDALGTSRQAAFQRFGKPVHPRTGAPMTVNPLPDAGRLALEVLEAWMSGRDDELIAKFDDTMRAQLPPDKLAQTWPQLTSLVGAYESCGDPVARPFGEHTIVNVPLEFEGGPMTGRVVFDADGRIAGLFVLRPGV
ncbi:DUF3887 domain-containing protein [Actinospica sp. MGRD01-02]|uniref:DUF3887 domain-containing protein n=1 Tax=Actinospica acidithermotolerans TaxID=2828514 RepID=A0A941IJ58_9ACTN|nr:DUF3887 domain-containing protein [Actinospica acidithermotolerans]MBR7829079.1 DUF3887 domain-containing protein [Actinospica acidithermotolerans]